MRYNAVIFDLDGTIIDTEKIWRQASTELIRRRGVILATDKHEELMQSIRGLAIHKSCLSIKLAANLHDELSVLIAEKSAIAHELYGNYVAYIPGFQEFHQQLQARAIKSGIATNASPETTALTDKILNLRQFFGEHIYDVSHVQYKNKPDPALYLHAAQKLCINPSQCIAIEDSAHGIAAAQGAGMYCIGINTARNRDFICEADLIVDHYREIDLNNIVGTE